MKYFLIAVSFLILRHRYASPHPILGHPEAIKVSGLLGYEAVSLERCVPFRETSAVKMEAVHSSVTLVNCSRLHGVTSQNLYFSSRMQQICFSEGVLKDHVMTTCVRLE